MWVGVLLVEGLESVSPDQSPLQMQWSGRVEDGFVPGTLAEAFTGGFANQTAGKILISRHAATMAQAGGFSFSMACDGGLGGAPITAMGRYHAGLLLGSPCADVVSTGLGVEAHAAPHASV